MYSPFSVNAFGMLLLFAVFVVEFFHRKLDNSLVFSSITYPFKNFSGLFFTARFTSRVGTPYSSATW